MSKETTNHKSSDRPEPPTPIIVIGAGASGMMAAILAARSGLRVQILEKQKKPGRKLLLTGNGRCNLTHLDPGLPSRYHSQLPGCTENIAGQVFSAFGVEATLNFFESLGLLTQDRDGYVYPMSAQAHSVLDVLLAELDRLHVRIRYDCEVTALDCDAASGLWRVGTEGWSYPARAVVLAAGSMAGIAESAGGRVRDPFQLATALGHTGKPPWPALTAMHCPDPDLALCDGARTKACVTLLHGSLLPHPGQPGMAGSLLPQSLAVARPILPAGPDGAAPSILPPSQGRTAPSILPPSQGRTAPSILPPGPDGAVPESGPVIVQEEGEVQWTASELSGIPLFQLSRYASGCSPSCPLMLSFDFLPGFEEAWIQDKLQSLLGTYRGTLSPSRLLGGFVHSRLATFLVKKSGYKDVPPAPEDEAALAQALAALLKRLILTADGVRDHSRAQICTGGVSLSEVEPETLSSRLYPGLFFSGEILDIDGPCGGYNLQWAWSSGAIAGEAAAKYAKGMQK